MLIFQNSGTNNSYYTGEMSEMGLGTGSPQSKKKHYRATTLPLGTIRLNTLISRYI